jgi:lysophospholipase L1-like esterase
MSRMRFSLPAFGILLLSFPCNADDFALKNGDTVVFLGDSITAARTYGKLIENYTLLRYPDRKIRFINAGIGGDTAAGGLKRLERDVFSQGATVLTVAFGVNDIGWGTKADDEHKQAYLDGIRGIVEECKKRNVRVFICSAASTAEDPAKADTGYLQKMCDEGMALSKSLGGQSIDVQRTMRGIQKRVLEANKNIKDKSKGDSLHTTDGVHLNDLGQLAMAFAILKGLGAPAEISSASLDAAKKSTLEEKGCKIEAVEGSGKGIKFTRLDEGLPFNNGTFYALNYRYVPVPEDLNRYQLAVQNLEKGRYDLIVEGRLLGTYSAEQLAKGINISSATADAWHPGGPWEVQANMVKELTEARYHVGTAKSTVDTYLPKSPLAGELDPKVKRFDDEIVEMQRISAKPRPYRFEVRPAVDKTKALQK